MPRRPSPPFSSLSSGSLCPLYFLHHIVTLPYLTDIETTPGEPLIFKVLNTQRPADANPLKIPDGSNAALQEEAYPDVAPMVLERAAPEVFSIVQEAVERLAWTIALSEPPGESGIGRIEATDQTLIMAYTEDVLVQVKGDDAHAVIDARSVSRYGWHDLGRNAERIRDLFEEISTALEKGEKTALEQAEPKKEEPAATQATRKPSKKSVRKKRRAD